MVGWMGGCCCGPTTPPQICTANTQFVNTLVEDFAPTFDPYFAWPTGERRGLQVIDEACLCLGPDNSNGFRSTQGYLWGYFKKATLEAPIEVSMELVRWDDEIYFGPPLVFFNDIQAKISIHIGNIQDFPPVYADSYSVVARGWWWNSTGYIVKVGTFTILLPIRPKAGDVFGMRLSDFTATYPLPDLPMVTPGKAEFILNGRVEYTVTDPQYFVSFSACLFKNGMFLKEPPFVGIGYSGPNRVIVDNWTHSSL